MRFEDEAWIRLYVRDTMTWKAWSWEAQGLFCMILRKLDRAGLMPLEGNPVDIAVAAMTGWPIAVVQKALPELMRQAGQGLPTLVVKDGTLVCPRFYPAQHASSTSTARSRAKREGDRALARAEALGLEIEVDPHGDNGDDGGFGEDEHATDAYATSRPVTQPGAAGRNSASRTATNIVNSINTGDQITDPDQDHHTDSDEPEDCRTVYDWLYAARVQLMPGCSRQTHTAGSMRCVRLPLRNGAKLADWKRVIDTQLESVRKMPRDKYRWLTLEVMSRNFSQILQRWEEANLGRSTDRRQQSRKKPPPPPPPPEEATDADEEQLAKFESIERRWAAQRKGPQ